MGTVKDLYLDEGVKKLKDLAEDIRICMFCTASEVLPFTTRPMAVQKVDEDGTVWFLSAMDSEKNYEILENAKVQLIFSKPGDSKFLVVYGIAGITKDRQKIEELWNPMSKTWFPGGKEDPNLTVVGVVPDSAYYWEAAHGKVVSLISIATSAISGKKDGDDGVQGQIKL